MADAPDTPAPDSPAPESGEHAPDSAELRPAAEAAGMDLGTRVASYDERDAMLYALAVGATAADLDLVFERRLRVLPTLGVALGLWASDELRERGFFSAANALHAGQRLEVREPLPPAGQLELQGRVGAVWDKGKAALFEVEVACEQFSAVYSIFAPGRGGWGGERGPSARRDPDEAPTRRARARTSPEQAVLYRLTGDRHLIHVDPEAARAAGLPRPILHGLCTLGFAVRELAGLLRAHPADLRSLETRFAAPVLPGDRLEVGAWEPGADGAAPFAVESAGEKVLTGGLVRFA